MRGLTPAELKQAVEEPLTLWATVAPLDFVELADSGPIPPPSDADYAAAGTPNIRFGHHTIDGANGPALAQAFLPYATDAGVAGDVHFDRDEDWSGAQGGFFWNHGYPSTNRRRGRNALPADMKKAHLK